MNTRQFLVGMGGGEDQNKVKGEEREREQVSVEKGTDFIGEEDMSMAQGDIYQWEWVQVSLGGGDRYRRNLQISWEGCRYQWKSGQMSLDEGKDI